MTTKQRMSPLTALFIGLALTASTGIIATMGVVLFGMGVIDSRADDIIDFAGDTIDKLPDIIESLPPAVQELLDLHRAPAYASNLAIEAGLVRDPYDADRIIPALSITNQGDKAVSLLSLHVSAVGSNKLPVAEWTEVAATPLGIDCQWRGPIMPGGKRDIVVSHWRRGLPASLQGEVSLGVEVSDIRVWEEKME